jgi:hypothetical protein
LTSLQLVKFDRAQGQRQRDGRRRGVDHPTLLDAVFHWPKFLGGLPLVAAQFGDQRDYSGVDLGHQPVGLLPL